MYFQIYIQKLIANMKTTDFARYLTDFFGQYLPIECGASKNTISAYSTTFTLLIKYMEKYEGVRPERLCLADFTNAKNLKNFSKNGWKENRTMWSINKKMPDLRRFTLFSNIYNIKT